MSDPYIEMGFLKEVADNATSDEKAKLKKWITNQVRNSAAIEQMLMTKPKLLAEIVRDPDIGKVLRAQYRASHPQIAPEAIEVVEDGTVTKIPKRGA